MRYPLTAWPIVPEYKLKRRWFGGISSIIPLFHRIRATMRLTIRGVEQEQRYNLPHCLWLAHQVERSLQIR